jgi:hypothetical protein
MDDLSVVAPERSRKRHGDLLPQVILEMSLSQKLPCLAYGVQSTRATCCHKNYLCLIPGVQSSTEP